MVFKNVEEFYPTPEALLKKITEGFDWRKIRTILEPSAGKGNIVDFVLEEAKKNYCSYELDIDCIEINPELQNVLKGKDLRLVHDDFLTYRTFKQYDLIIMNPPFSEGAAHLMKALEMQESGGGVLCILNAETLKNPCTNERKALALKLEDLNAEITYLQSEFATAERPTGVEIAVIKVYIEAKQYDSFIYESLQKKSYVENSYQNMTDLAPNDFIEAIVAMYNMEIEAGTKLIREYKAMCPHIMDSFEGNTYDRPILSMKVGDRELSVNAYVKCVRQKYWNALFSNRKFTGNMTSNLSNTYHQQVNNLANYDFSLYNIKCIQEEMSRNLVKGVEDCIVELFDQLSYQYAYSDELSKNIHYYNGWKTNKAWIINRKVILPCMDAFRSWNGKYDPDYSVMNKLADIEKALNYLDGGLTACRDMYRILENSKQTGQTKKIRLKYFYVTFYKKGTCHIEFTNEELLKKLNIFGSQQKRWLPPGYGKKTYQEMDAEERAVIDEFEGAESYQKTLANASYYIYDPKTAVPLLEEKIA